MEFKTKYLCKYVAVTAVPIFLLITVSAAPAFAWDGGYGPNGYGPQYGGNYGGHPERLSINIQVKVRVVAILGHDSLRLFSNGLLQLPIHQPRYLLLDEIEDLKQSDQAALLSLMQSGVSVETKVKSTRAIKFKCSVFATSNDTKKLRVPLLSRFAVINIPEYNKEQFISVTKDRLGDNPLTEYIANEVYQSSKNPNIRDCVRIANIAKTKQDVLRTIRVLVKGSDSDVTGELK
jgi:hypothetical protein